jgi:hypothetical protein
MVVVLVEMPSSLEPSRQGPFAGANHHGSEGDGLARSLWIIVDTVEGLYMLFFRFTDALSTSRCYPPCGTANDGVPVAFSIQLQLIKTSFRRRTCLPLTVLLASALVFELFNKSSSFQIRPSPFTGAPVSLVCWRLEELQTYFWRCEIRLY